LGETVFRNAEGHNLSFFEILSTTYFMANTPSQPSVKILRKGIPFACLFFSIIFSSCKQKQPQIYKSSCDDGIVFKRVTFTKLIDSIQQYDHQYIEVDGTYVEGNEESALVNDSTFVSHSNDHAIWINFSQDCPLYLTGTHQGLFEFNDGKFTKITNKKITIRGKIDVRHKGHLGSYRGSMDRVSFVSL
jgi:hypothetical protein